MLGGCVGGNMAACVLESSPVGDVGSAGFSSWGAAAVVATEAGLVGDGVGAVEGARGVKVVEAGVVGEPGVGSLNWWH